MNREAQHRGIAQQQPILSIATCIRVSSPHKNCCPVSIEGSRQQQATYGEPFWSSALDWASCVTVSPAAAIEAPFPSVSCSQRPGCVLRAQ